MSVDVYKRQVKNLTPELKDAHKEIPWRAISGMRDITAHKYQTLRKEDVYSTCIDDIPVFERQLIRLIQEKPCLLYTSRCV